MILFEQKKKKKGENERRSREWISRLEKNLCRRRRRRSRRPIRSLNNTYATNFAHSTHVQGARSYNGFPSPI